MSNWTDPEGAMTALEICNSIPPLPVIYRPVCRDTFGQSSRQCATFTEHTPVHQPVYFAVRAWTAAVLTFSSRVCSAHVLHLFQASLIERLWFTWRVLSLCS
ncbi:hypothetical protein PoB_003754000 [Plakobranchus ocellatus]|uniref:Uncharacterized protein n=1 Tax=Plakobranchus ocellatus TaxID=259542 RepID=A0AAV4ARV7_9GAST|nr:hypothetical protein PoB_003754000 [Plakobranchus ocellatus]